MGAGRKKGLRGVGLRCEGGTAHGLSFGCGFCFRIAAYLFAELACVPKEGH